MSMIFNGIAIAPTRIDLTAGAGAPTAPTGLTATPASSTQIDLAWTDNASDEDGFKIERSTDGASWSQIDTAAANATSYSDTGRTADTKYYYRVRAYKGSNNSAYTNWATAIPTTLLDSLISYWHLDEMGDAVTRPDAHGANDLTAAYTGFGGGKLYNRNAYFRSDNFANNGRLRIADNASLSVGDEDFTFTCWVKLDNKASGNTAIMGKDASGDRGYALIYVPGSDRFRWHIGDSGSTIQSILANNAGSPTQGEWYFIVAWHDASANEIGIQVNNGTADTATATVTPADNDSGFAIGRQGDFTADGQYMEEGHVDGAAFWKKVLSTEEKTRLYNGGAGMMYPFSDDAAPTLPTLDADEFMLAIIPDSQRYMENDTAELENIMNWIVANDADADKKIEHALHVGDIVKNGTAAEFTRADTEFDILDAGSVKYLVTVGNHDYDTGVPDGTRDTTEFNVRFPQSRFTGQTGWSGGFEDGTLSDNAYWTRTIGGNDYIFITMEFAPRQDVITWADGLLTTHSDKRAVIITHHWLTDAVERFTSSDTYSGDDAIFDISTDNNDADEMWTELVKLHSNIVLVAAGHWGRGWRQDAGDNGNPVTQMTYSHHGDGWLRLVAIKPTDNRIDVYTYNPTYGVWDRTPNNEFSVELE